MATIFPLSASVGQQYDGYQFDGTAWNLLGNEFNPTYYSPTPPDNPQPGDLWVDSDSESSTGSLSDYATLAYVNSQINNIDGGNP